MNKKFTQTEPWSKAENELLLEFYYTLSRKAFSDILPDRNVKEVTAQVKYLEKKGFDFNK